METAAVSLPPIDRRFRVKTPNRLPDNLRSIDDVTLHEYKEMYTALVMSIDGQLLERKQSIEDIEDPTYVDWRRRALVTKSLAVMSLRRVKGELRKRRTAKNDLVQTMRELLVRATESIMVGDKQDRFDVQEAIDQFLSERPYEREL